MIIHYYDTLTNKIRCGAEYIEPVRATEIVANVTCQRCVKSCCGMYDPKYVALTREERMLIAKKLDDLLYEPEDGDFESDEEHAEIERLSKKLLTTVPRKTR